MMNALVNRQNSPLVFNGKKKCLHTIVIQVMSVLMLVGMLVSKSNADQIVSLPSYLTTLDVSPWSEPTRSALKILKEGDCPRAWGILWAAAKKSDRDATFALAQSTIAVGGIKVPGDSNKTYFRNRISLLSHGLLSGNRNTLIVSRLGNMRNKLIELIKGYELNPADATVVECYRLNADPARCLTIGIKAGSIDDFATLARRVDESTDQKRNRGQCSYAIR